MVNGRLSAASSVSLESMLEDEDDVESSDETDWSLLRLFRLLDDECLDFRLFFFLPGRVVSLMTGLEGSPIVISAS